MLLSVIDPLNHLNNIGKNANAYQLQSMFKAAYIALHANQPGKKLKFMFDSKRIMFPF